MWHFVDILLHCSTKGIKILHFSQNCTSEATFVRLTCIAGSRFFTLRGTRYFDFKVYIVIGVLKVVLKTILGE